DQRGVHVQKSDTTERTTQNSERSCHVCVLPLSRRFPPSSPASLAKTIICCRRTHEQPKEERQRRKIIPNDKFRSVLRRHSSPYRQYCRLIRFTLRTGRRTA